MTEGGAQTMMDLFPIPECRKRKHEVDGEDKDIQTDPAPKRQETYQAPSPSSCPSLSMSMSISSPSSTPPSPSLPPPTSPISSPPIWRGEEWHHYFDCQGQIDSHIIFPYASSDEDEDRSKDEDRTPTTLVFPSSIELPKPANHDTDNKTTEAEAIPGPHHHDQVNSTPPCVSSQDEFSPPSPQSSMPSVRPPSDSIARLLPAFMYLPRSPPQLPPQVLALPFGAILFQYPRLTKLIDDYHRSHGLIVFNFWTNDELLQAVAWIIPPKVLANCFSNVLCAAPVLSWLIERYHHDLGCDYFSFFPYDTRGGRRWPERNDGYGGEVACAQSLI